MGWPRHSPGALEGSLERAEGPQNLEAVNTQGCQSRDDGCSPLAELHSLDLGERRSIPGQTWVVVLPNALARDW